MSYNISFREKTKTNEIKKRYNILIVDDDTDMSKMLCLLLESRGHRVIVVNEPVQCISKCQNEYFDIIFMDFHMELLDGIDLTDLLKESYENNSLIFAFTGDSSSSAISKFKKHGMTGALIKPVNVNIIERLMNSMEIRNDIDKKIIKLNCLNSINKSLIMFS